MGTYLRKEQCPQCADDGYDNTGDNLAIYDDGVYCQRCNYQEHEEKKVMTEKPKKQGAPLIPYGEYKDIISRNITEEICRKYRYSWTEYKGEKVQCASFYDEGRIVSQKLRTKNKDFRWLGDKSKVLPLFGQDLYEPNAKLNVTVCEGELDTLALSTLNSGEWPVVGLLDGAGGQGLKSIAKAKEFLNGYKTVTLLFDGDEAGRKCASEAAKLMPGKIKVVNMPDGEDVCSMVKAGRGAELKKLEQRAVSHKPKDIITLDDYTLEELYTKEAVGIPLKIYPKLSNMIRGLKGGRLYTFCAGSGLGKSTMIKEIAYFLMNSEQINTGSVFLEQGDREAMRDYIALHCNIEAEDFSEDPGRADKVLRKEGEQLLRDHAVFYKHFGSLATDYLLSKIEYMMTASDCPFVFLDHISMVISGSDASGNERKDIDILMTKLRSLIQSTGKSVIAICHLKRPPGTSKPYNEGGTVSLSDLRGSAGIEQMSDFVIGLERDQFSEEGSTLTKVKVLKSRRGGKVGYADILDYNYKTGRLLPVAGDK